MPSFISFALFVNTPFFIGDDETIHRYPTLDQYRQDERVLSAIWDEHGGCICITANNEYTFLPF